MAGTSFDMTEPAAITEPAPILTPGKTVTLAPHQQLLVIIIGASFSYPAFRSGHASEWTNEDNMA